MLLDRTLPLSLLESRHPRKSHGGAGVLKGGTEVAVNAGFAFPGHNKIDVGWFELPLSAEALIIMLQISVGFWYTWFLAWLVMKVIMWLKLFPHNDRPRRREAQYTICAFVFVAYVAGSCLSYVVRTVARRTLSKTQRWIVPIFLPPVAATAPTVLILASYVTIAIIRGQRKNVKLLNEQFISEEGKGDDKEQEEAPKRDSFVQIEPRTGTISDLDEDDLASMISASWSLHTFHRPLHTLRRWLWP